MKRLWAWLPLVVLGWGATEVAAQALPGTTVQLPTYSFYGVGTTVSVPDRGSVLMGGINRASSGRNEFGSPLSPFRNSSIGSERSASSMRMHVWIHDFEAMDEMLLSQPTNSTTLSSLPAFQPPDNPFVQMVVKPQEPGAGSSWELSSRDDSQDELPLSVAAERQRRVSQQRARSAEADDYFARGQKAEADGKQNVAKIYYQMAARRATGELKSQVAAKLEAIGRTETGSAVVRSGQ